MINLLLLFFLIHNVFTTTFFLQSSKYSIERSLDIALVPQVLEENHDLDHDLNFIDETSESNHANMHIFEKP